MKKNIEDFGMQDLLYVLKIAVIGLLTSSLVMVNAMFYLMKQHDLGSVHNDPIEKTCFVSDTGSREQNDVKLYFKGFNEYVTQKK